MTRLLILTGSVLVFGYVFAKSSSVLILLAIIVATGFQLIRFAHITEGLEVADHDR